MSEALSETWFAARDVFKRYPGVSALDGASIEVERGIVEGLVGKNGAGKSTLIKIVTGAETADAGSLTLAGEQCASDGIRGARSRGIIAVPQEVALFPDLSVTENLLLPDQFPRRAARIAWREARLKARQALDRMEVDVGPDVLVRRLSVPTQRAVMIAQALVRQPKLLILDEPTEAFAEPEVERLFTVVRALVRDGVSVVYVSHRLEEVMELSDHITVLRDGATVARLARRTATRAEVVGAIVGPEGEIDSRHRPRALLAQKPDEVPVLSVRALTGRRLRAASVTVRPGEVVGLYGLAGVGRSELLRAVAGAAPYASGEIDFDGRNMRGDSLRRRRSDGILFLPEDRAALGVLPHLTVRENVVIGAKYSGLRLLPWKLKARERRLATGALAAVGLADSSLEKSVSTLSGGNQQKVLLARGLASRARLWLLAEPTVGLDVAARADLFSTLRGVIQGEIGESSGPTQKGGALVAMSDYGDLAALVDRLYVLRNGHVVEEFQAGQFSEDELLHAVSFGRTEGGGSD